MDKKRLRKTTTEQYDELLNFVQENKIILHNRTKPSEVNAIKKLWSNFAERVNSLGLGPVKTADQWKKILVEWKSNTKRKHREIKIDVTRTGGGKRSTKKLMDNEQRLLSLLSDIHLGIDDLPDTLGFENDNETQIEIPQFQEIPQSQEIDEQWNNDFCMESQTEELQNEVPTHANVQPLKPIIISNILLNNPALDELGRSPMCSPKDLMSEHQPSTSNHSSKTKKENKKTSNSTKYTNHFVASAAASYNEAQEMRYNAAVKNAEAIEFLGSSIASFASAYKERSEIEKMKAEAEKMKAEAEIIKAQALLMQARTHHMKLELQFMNDI